MFDEKKVGIYIMTLRKSKGMTQARLAQSLNVSHQAVSNWERGESMPDIAALPGLASVLGVTTDRILAAAGKDFDGFDEILENIEVEKALQDIDETGGESMGEIVNDSSSARELEARIAQLEAKDTALTEEEAKLEGTLATLGKQTEASGTSPELLGKIRLMTRTVEAKLNAVREDKNFTENEIKALKDGLSGQNTAGEEAIIAELLTLPGLEDFDPSAPPEHQAPDVMKDSPAESADEKFDFSSIHSIAPFASNETLDKLIRRAVDRGVRDLHKFISIAPFLSKQSIDYLVSTVKIEDGFDFKKIRSLAPFMSRDSLKELIMKYKMEGNFDINEIKPLLPFLDRGTIDALIEESIAF